MAKMLHQNSSIQEHWFYFKWNKSNNWIWRQIPLKIMCFFVCFLSISAFQWRHGMSSTKGIICALNYKLLQLLDIGLENFASHISCLVQDCSISIANVLECSFALIHHACVCFILCYLPLLIFHVYLLWCKWMITNNWLWSIMTTIDKQIRY